MQQRRDEKAGPKHKQTDKSKMNKTRQLIQNKWAIVVWEKKGQFILVSHWPFKLDLECCWWAEVYQCPCPVGYELIPWWYSWCCEQICVLTPPRDTIRTPHPLTRGRATAVKAREVEQSAHSLRHQHNAVCPRETNPCCSHRGLSSFIIKSEYLSLNQQQQSKTFEVEDDAAQRPPLAIRDLRGCTDSARASACLKYRLSSVNQILI